MRALFPLALVLLTACTTRQATFPGEASDVVWTAMKAVANEPRYDEWIVRTNEVHVVEGERRVEVFRELRRDRVGPGQPRWRDEQAWKFTILLGESKDHAPEATFKSRDWGVPAHAWSEADRFFADVRRVLERPEGMLPRDAATSPPAPAPTVVTPSAAAAPPPAPAPAAPAPESKPATAPPVDLPD